MKRLVEYAFFSSLRQDLMGSAAMWLRSVFDSELDGNTMIIKKKQICLILGQALAAGLFSTGTNAVFAQAPTPTERITVTGSNISRASAEGVLPVQTISREAIQSSAAATAGELLQNLVSNSSGTFSTASGTGNDWSGVNFANLRGIGSSSTLILLNGRRVASFAIGAAGVDLNSIPLAAIDRIEVLRDGASAIYGADAIGGVINFITKPSYVGVEAGANYQIADGGVGAERRVNASIGFGDFDKENFNIMIAADRTTTAAIHSSERPDLGGPSYSGQSWPGTWAPVVANPNPNDPTSPGPWIRANANTAPFVAPPQGCGGVTPSTITSGTRCLTNTRDFLNILPPQTKENFVALGSFKINQDHKAFGEFSHFKTDTVSKITPTPVNEAFGGPGGTLGPAFYIPAGSKYNTTGQDIAIRSRLVEYGSRTSQNIASGDRVVAGVKGTIKDWEYEVNTGRSTYNVGVSYLAGYANRELLYQAYSNGLINPFGNTDAADFQAFRNLAGIEGKLRDSTFTTSWVGAKANGEPFHVAAGPVGVAMGVERRKETMNDDPGEILRQGLDMAGSGETLPVSGSRTVNAIFGEMAIPLVKGLEAQIAARVDDYSDFGRTTNPKVGLRWQPDKSFMVRASYGEGFRAPTLDELYSQQQTGNASSSFNDPNRCGKAGGDASYDCGADSKLQYNIKSGGNTQLKPETSDQYSIGFVWQPTNWFSADIGIWDVKITNQIQAGIDEALLINDLVNNNGALYGNYVVRYAPSASDIANGLPGKIQYLDERNINYAATKAGGIDYDLLVKLPEFGGAKWALQLVGSHMLKYKTGPQATGPIDVLNKFRINGNTIVKDRFQLSLRTQAGTWGATLSGNYVGSFEDENPNGEGAKVASYLTWDGQVRYSGFKDLTILGGVKNMFNKRPPYTNQESEIWYPGFNPYLHDVRNRMVYVGLTYKFK